MIKLKICDSAPQFGCAYYRSLGVLKHLEKIMDIHVEHLSKVAWHIINDADILFLERPQNANFLEAIGIAKELGIKIWIDYDDLLHKIPAYNPGYNFFNSPETKQMIEKSIRLADIVTVATPGIKKYYQKFNENIFVIGNAWNDYNYPWIKKEKPAEFINWRGSNTHRGDLQTVEPDIHEIALKYDKWHWSFIGNNIWFITRLIKNLFHLQEVDVVKYLKFIRENKFAIQIIPLAFNEFNKAKSNIGWIEGTCVGAATLAPDFPEFDKPGVVKYSEGKFKYYLEKLINSAEFRKKQYIESFEYIAENLMLSKINHRRKEVVERLLS